MWDLYLAYEEMLKLNEPIDPDIELNDQESKILQAPIAVIESAEKKHTFTININLRKKRQVPPNLNINLQSQLPPAIDLKALPQQTQEILNQILAQISAQLPQLVQSEVARQSPLIGFDVRAYGGRWIADR